MKISTINRQIERAICDSSFSIHTERGTLSIKMSWERASKKTYIRSRFFAFLVNILSKKKVLQHCTLVPNTISPAQKSICLAMTIQITKKNNFVVAIYNSPLNDKLSKLKLLNAFVIRIAFAVCSFMLLDWIVWSSRTHDVPIRKFSNFW